MVLTKHLELDQNSGPKSLWFPTLHQNMVDYGSLGAFLKAREEHTIDLINATNKFLELKISPLRCKTAEIRVHV